MNLEELTLNDDILPLILVDLVRTFSLTPFLSVNFLEFGLLVVSPSPILHFTFFIQPPIRYDFTGKAP